MCAVAVIAAFLYMAFSIEPRLEPAHRPRSHDQPIGTNDQFASQGAVRPDPREAFWQWTIGRDVRLATEAHARGHK
jgi:hypothetical protein